MRIRIDEAGDFNYRDETRVWISVVGGIVIPDKRWASIEAFVVDRKWTMPELKAAEMTDAQLLEVAEFIVAHDLTVGAIATDSHIFTADAQREWREKQVAGFRAAADRSRRAVEDEQTAERVERLRRRMHQERYIKQPSYLQYGILMPWLLSHLISASLLVYRALPPDDDSWGMDIVLDAQSGADPGKAGELLRDTIEAIFAGDERTALRMAAGPSVQGQEHRSGGGRNQRPPGALARHPPRNLPRRSRPPACGLRCAPRAETPPRRTTPVERSVAERSTSTRGGRAIYKVCSG
ncbi:MAG: hypothetical protein M3198_10545 [Actinomycetota bacterium]|nr:hypothetical protein [Actinomycetota bacterium]